MRFCPKKKKKECHKPAAVYPSSGWSRCFVIPEMVFWCQFMYVQVENATLSAMYLFSLNGIMFNFSITPSVSAKCLCICDLFSRKKKKKKRKVVAWFTRHKHSPLIFSKPFQNFHTHQFKNSSLGVVLNLWRCSSRACVSLLVFLCLSVVLLGDVCECFHGNVDNFHLLKALEPRARCKSAAKWGRPFSPDYIFYIMATF